MQHILTIKCPDRIGIVAAISQQITASSSFIDELNQFGDHDTGRFFMRVVLNSGESDPEAKGLHKRITAIAPDFAMEWNLRPAVQRKKMLLMVSKFDHCLRDLLYRQRTGTLDTQITAIVSNHETLAPIAERQNIPFHHVPVTKYTKPEAEEQLRKVIADTASDLIVLARYMQVLSPQICSDFPAQIINIHHSFLPSFKGAKPYHQAHARGVKLIGATAHYVTNDLDEGPIIEQQVEPVSHHRSANDLVAIGRDVEALTLARAVRLHVEDRVFLNGHRTIVFD